VESVTRGTSGKKITGIEFDGTQPCRQTDPEIFFPEKGGNAFETKVAVNICRTCRFINPCLEFAIETHALGIWGGTTERQRRTLRKQKGQP
jgi:WhiB family redox-sensing transcriptional regulator